MKRKAQSEFELLKARVLYEDNHLLAINKQSGEISQGDKTRDEPLPELIKRWIKIRDDKPGAVYLGVVHRLDRPVSGVILFAKTSKALERLNKAFQQRQVKKTYWALIHGKLPNTTGKLVHWLKKNPKGNWSKAWDKEVEGSKRSELTYNTVAIVDRYYLLEVNPATGRHHQIRTQLARAASPIIGDTKYGYPKPNKDSSICLHARSLELEHPVRKEPLLITAPLPFRHPDWKPVAEFD